MDGFRVDVDELAAAGAALGSAADPGARLAGSAAPGASAVGHARLAGAMDAVAVAWRAGEQVLEQDVTRAATALKFSSLAYELVDATAATAFRRIGAPLR